MKTSGPELRDISDMLCSTCGRPFEVTITQTPEGKHETYLQCWICHYSIKLQRHEPRRESATVH